MLFVVNPFIVTRFKTIFPRSFYIRSSKCIKSVKIYNEMKQIFKAIFFDTADEGQLFALNYIFFQLKRS